MNSITTFFATALVLFAIGQGIAAARADGAPQNVLSTSAGELAARPAEGPTGLDRHAVGANPIVWRAERPWLKQ